MLVFLLAVLASANIKKATVVATTSLRRPSSLAVSKRGYLTMSDFSLSPARLLCPPPA